MTKSNFHKLQHVQNTLARVVLRRGKFEHITTALKELHRLPVKHRVTYKLATLAFTIKSTGQPIYLRELLLENEPARTLRSSSKHLLSETASKSTLFSRGFAAAVWNNLPDSIRCCKTFASFKRNVKTYLFNLAFPA